MFLPKIPILTTKEALLAFFVRGAPDSIFARRAHWRKWNFDWTPATRTIRAGISEKWAPGPPGGDIGAHPGPGQQGTRPGQGAEFRVFGPIRAQWGLLWAHFRPFRDPRKTTFLLCNVTGCTRPGLLKGLLECGGFRLRVPRTRLLVAVYSPI